jgi:hypothetical protein
MTTTYTKFWRFPKPDFLSEPWQQGVWDTFDAIDQTLYNTSISYGLALWANSTSYIIGNMAIDNADGSTWLCVTDHTSAVSPTIFAEDRTNNPAFWTGIQLSIRARGQWLQNTLYLPGDMVYDTTSGRNIYAICATKHTSTATGNITNDSVYWNYTYNSLAPDTASGIGYDHTVSGLVATDVQHAIDESFSKVLHLTGGVVTGPITLPADPTGNLDAATKQYVDAHGGTGGTAGVTSVTPGPGIAGGGTGSVTISVAAAGITNSMLAVMAALRLKGNNAASAGAPVDLTAAQAMTLLGAAPLASPAFTGAPTAPTPSPGNNSTNVATTAFVTTSFAPLASPLFTGNPTAPTVTPSTDSTTKLATTAFVASALPVASNLNPVMNGVAAAGVGVLWARTDHVHPSDTSRLAVVGGQTISGGFALTPNNLGTIGVSLTPNPLLGNYQFGTNNGAIGINVPTVDCAMDILVINGTTAGAITFSGYTVGATGDGLTTTNGNKFIISIRRINAVSTYIIKALQ